MFVVEAEEASLIVNWVEQAGTTDDTRRFIFQLLLVSLGLEGVLIFAFVGKLVVHREVVEHFEDVLPSVLDEEFCWYTEVTGSP